MVYPISPRDPVNRAPGSGRAEGVSQSKTTAAKVSQIKLPIIQGKTGLGDRQITPLQDARELYKNINQNWNVLAPAELAEQIIELENKVSLLTEHSSEVEKIKREAEHLHFRFVFPVAIEMDEASSGKSMPISFARTICQAADRVFKTHSLSAFNQLNAMQKQEVLRIAAGGKS